MKYNILVINWQDITNPLGGGAEVHFHEIFKRIAAQGHLVTLLCCKYKNCKTEEIIDGIRIIRKGSRNLFNYIVPFKYFKLSRKNNFDVVIDDINKIPFFTPLFVKKPLIGIIHHLFGSSIFIETNFFTALYVNFAERLIPAIYRNIPMTVVSNSTKDELINKGFDTQNISIIYNGVDTSNYKVIHSIKSNVALIGYLGRIKKYKSVDHLIIAFNTLLKKIPQAKLLIMGDGDYVPYLKALSSSLKLDNSISFTGPADESSKIENLNKIWFSVNPSPKEGWGLTVIESNACATPVIAADSPGLRDSVVHNETGLLYEYGDCDKLANKMIDLIENNELRQLLSNNCLNWAKKFEWDISAQKMIDLIESTITI